MNTRSVVASLGVRERILETALDEFYASGFHGATMRNIANSAGCSAANVYNHFENKSELLVEILRRASDEQFTATRNALRKAGPHPVDRWRAAVVAHALFTARNPRACLVANSELRYLGGEVDRKRVVAPATRRNSCSSTSRKTVSNKGSSRFRISIRRSRRC